MMVDLFRYGSEPSMGVDPSQVETPRTHIKPSGLWFSLGEAWKEWCETERFLVDRLAVRTELRLTAPRRSIYDTTPGGVLWLETWDEAMRFDGRYGRFLNGVSGYVDWEPVMARWQGIVIVEPRPAGQWLSGPMWMPLWIYSWDVASGCVWRPDAVQVLGWQRSAILERGG